MEIILAKNSFGIYPFLYVTKGISKEDILAFIGMRIYNKKISKYRMLLEWKLFI